MPIRMERDPQRNRPQRNRDPRRPGGGGGGGLGSLLPYLLMFLFRKPKLLIPVLIIGGLYYFFSGGCNVESNFSPANPANPDAGIDANTDADPSQFSFGAALSEERFDKAQVFEPLTYATTLPPRVSLQQYAPTPQHQGQQGSCVGWASSFAARTILHSRATGQPANQVAFSPSYLYNQIALRGCQGAYMLDAMKAMQQGGTLPIRQYPYDDDSCSDMPNSSEQAAAERFRIKGYNRLTLGANNYQIDMNAMRQNLAQGAPVVIGMQVGGSFMQAMRGREHWQPNRRDYSKYGYSGHAMTVIGYDDNYPGGGAFQLQNSWGTDWGDGGYAWVNYDDFQEFTREAYGLHPMGSAEDRNFDPNRLAVQLGLVNNATADLIDLRPTGDNTFRTTRPLSPGDKFKLAVTNSVECYTYVFGQETDGSSYVLFPYTEKHSAYCGIIGTRVFPRDYSMTPDNIGDRDYFAVVISKTELDYDRLNAQLSSARGGTYGDKLDRVLGDRQVRRPNFSQDGQAIAFDAELNGATAVGLVVEVDKR